MTAPLLSRAQADAAVAALDLTVAKLEGNLTNLNAILRENDPADLMVGFLLLVSSLRSSLATAWGVAPAGMDEFDATLRLMYADPEPVT